MRENEWLIEVGFRLPLESVTGRGRSRGVGSVTVASSTRMNSVPQAGQRVAPGGRAALHREQFMEAG